MGMDATGMIAVTMEYAIASAMRGEIKGHHWVNKLSEAHASGLFYVWKKQNIFRKTSPFRNFVI
jgi:hypothetical protein